MKKKPDSVTLPTMKADEIQEWLPKTETVQLRVSVKDKASIVEAAQSLHLTTTEYMLKCHELISSKLKAVS